MTVLVRGMRTLSPSGPGGFTKQPETLTNELLRELLDMDKEWKPASEAARSPCPFCPAQPISRSKMALDATPAESLIRQYYACFNERRLTDLAAWFDDDAIVEHMPRRPAQRGGEGYLQFVNAWIAAFPDAVLAIERIVPRGTHTHEVTLLATGTHQGGLELGGWIFRPTGARVALHLREVLELRENKVVFSTVSFDLQQMVEQLTRVDSAKLLKHLEHLRELGAQLPAIQGDAARTRDVLDRIGRELDAARHIVRPYYR